ncbi:Ycf66 family protein [Cyanobium gracile UHCC 0139]|uniref:Ycf66 family protein n=1 Tax=Cyanobium gracile UHCC 0139 TaxID=3110308 RepID=A0ABU5RTS8_9CYAN|nr:Ycf66 family protein [Cyanobium gracile]MEA5391171.1 Ycf66 family protein [Cyanobium gracile UHCC 0139]
MLATLGGFLALLLGLLLLLLPLLASELSRARDSVWGAVVLLLGLVLVTSAERLTGAPMLAVLCGGLLIGRLGVEVGQARWRLLSEEERQRLWSWERWQTSLSQLGASLAQLLQLARGVVSGLGAWVAERRAARPAVSKRWVRPEADPPEVAAVAEVAETSAAEPEPDEEPVPDDGPLVVDGFEAIDALLEQAVPETPETVSPPETAAAGEGLGEAG